ncbi:MAG: hypothetical protein ABIJ86_02820 [Spirochaetota bacterium]
MALLVWPGWLAKPAWLAWFLWLSALACVPPGWAQVSGHQRLGVESKTYWEANIDLAVRLSPAGYADYDLPELDSSLSLGLLLGRKWGIGLSVPASLSNWPSNDATRFLIPGDVTASMGWTEIQGDSRLRGSLNLTGPSALWQGGLEIPGSVAGGSGRWTLGLSGGLSRIIDPLVLSGLLSWNVGLPRAERWNSRWRPGDFSLVMSVTEAFNEHVSCTLGLSQYASLPERVWPTIRESSWGSLPYGIVVYDASAGIDFLFSGQSFTMGMGFSKGLVHGADSGSMQFSVGYGFRQREAP